MISDSTQTAVSPTVIRTMRGLGDTVYQRAFIHEGLVDTPWPELFEDRPMVKCVEPVTNLRTQKKNSGKFTGWHERPDDHDVVNVSYDSKNIAIQKNIPKIIERQIGDGRFVFDLPNFGPSPIEGKYAIVKPNTVRKEWACPSRNCKSDYISTSASILRDMGYRIIGIADLEEGEEWIDGVPPIVDEQYYRGEFEIKELISLVQHAEVMVSSVGWPLPTCIAAGTPLICIGGGLGRFNRPSVVTDERMDLSNFHFIEPDNYCLCGDMNHKCDKTITDFEVKFIEAMSS
jgi:hypothetical protein